MIKINKRYLFYIPLLIMSLSFSSNVMAFNIYEEINKPIEKTFNAVSKGLTGGAREEAEKFLNRLNEHVTSILNDVNVKTEARLNQVKGIVDSSLFQVNQLIEKVGVLEKQTISDIKKLEEITFKKLFAFETQLFDDVSCSIDQFSVSIDTLVDDFKNEIRPGFFSWFRKKTSCENFLNLDLDDLEQWHKVDMFRYQDCRTSNKIANENNVENIMAAYAQLRIYAGQLHCASRSGGAIADDWYGKQKYKIDHQYNTWKWAQTL